MRGRTLRYLALALLAALIAAGLPGRSPTQWSALDHAAEAQTVKDAQKRKDRRLKRQRPRPAPASPAREAADAPRAPAATPSEPAAAGALREKIEADVSARTIAVTSGFTGTEIIVFGSVHNSRQPSAESGYYDLVVIVEGAGAPLVVRRKSRLGGLWINTQAASFVSVPSYYAITSTRPLDEVASTSILGDNQIGLDHVRMTPTATTETALSAAELTEFRASIVRLREKEDLYFTDPYGVGFIGTSLFRSTIELPANVPVGPLTARVYLFHEGEILSEFSSRVALEREGLELLLYRFAMNYSLLYGIFAVLVATGAGLLASAFFGRPVQ